MKDDTFHTCHYQKFTLKSITLPKIDIYAPILLEKTEEKTKLYCMMPMRNLFPAKCLYQKGFDIAIYAQILLGKRLNSISGCPRSNPCVFLVTNIFLAKQFLNPRINFKDSLSVCQSDSFFNFIRPLKFLTSSALHAFSHPPFTFFDTSFELPFTSTSFTPRLYIFQYRPF
uniref:Uncharacterized protein n=1 Tax=Photinus pyralis TaxID=7054 RepID=A0A1Y1MB73_PHOPY